MDLGRAAEETVCICKCKALLSQIGVLCKFYVVAVGEDMVHRVAETSICGGNDSSVVHIWVQEPEWESAWTFFQSFRCPFRSPVHAARKVSEHAWNLLLSRTQPVILGWQALPVTAAFVSEALLSLGAQVWASGQVLCAAVPPFPFSSYFGGAIATQKNRATLA